MKHEKVGVVLVHGIGKQKRFEHLQEVARDIVKAIKSDPFYGSTLQIRVEIKTSSDSSYAASHQTWSGDGVPVKVFVKDPLGAITELNFHEVWWADLGEPTTIKTVLNFWFWGLSLWTNQGYFKNLLIDENPNKTRLPKKDGRPVSRVDLKGRFELFGISLVAILIMPVLAAFNRVLGIIDVKLPLDIVSQYLSRVKIFQQSSRISSSPLASLNEPPRFSIRRRMIQCLVDVATRDYDRWYLFAHSQGSVLAFNGLMEIDQVLPKYLDEELWERAHKCGLIGKENDSDKWVKGITKPENPFWLEPGSFVDRNKLFSKLRGFMTYGSPLNKIAVLWPALVRLNKDESVFSSDFEWINIYDPMDPVAGRTHFFAPESEQGIKSLDIPYKARGWHLSTHLGYLKPSNSDNKRLVNSVASWLIYGSGFRLPSALSENRAKVRDINRVSGWWLIGLLIAFVPTLLEIAGSLLRAVITLSPEPIFDFVRQARYFLSFLLEIFYSGPYVIFSYDSPLSSLALFILTSTLIGVILVTFVGTIAFIIEKVRIKNLNIATETIYEYLRERPSEEFSFAYLKDKFHFYDKRTVRLALANLASQKAIACKEGDYKLPNHNSDNLISESKEPESKFSFANLFKFSGKKEKVKSISDYDVNEMVSYFMKHPSKTLSYQELCKKFDQLHPRRVRLIINMLVSKTILFQEERLYYLPTLSIKAVESLEPKLPKYPRKDRVDLCRRILKDLTLNPKASLENHIQITFGVGEECIWVLGWEQLLIFHTLHYSSHEPVMIILDIVDSKDFSKFNVDQEAFLEAPLGEKVNFLMQRNPNFIERLRELSAKELHIGGSLTAKDFTQAISGEDCA